MDIQLFIRYFQKDCSQEELKQIEEWISADKANADCFFEMERIWSLKTEAHYFRKEELAKAYHRFTSAHPVVRGHQRKKHYLIRLGYVAAILVIAILGFNIYKLQNKIYSIEEKTCVVEVPKGQRSTVTLIDGSKVWLNAESKLVYPATLATKGNRIVTLEGEAYFEIMHDEKHPFIIQTPSVDVTVLGTKFNVEAYPDEATLVTLTEGAVKVSTKDETASVVLAPKEQAFYSAEKGLSLIRDREVELINIWTKGEISYVNRELAYIVKDLTRRFNERIVILDTELESELFTCRVKENSTLEQVLTLLKDTRKIDYRKSLNGYEIVKYKN